MNRGEVVLLVALVVVLAVVGARRRLALCRKRAAVLEAVLDARRAVLDDPGAVVDPHWEARTRKALLSTIETVPIVRIPAQREPS